jgi:diguanylate cyclase (GGDEF)-like protein
VGRAPTYRAGIAALGAIVFVGVVAVPKRVEIGVNFGVIATLFLAMALDLHRYAKHERRMRWPILLALPLIAGCVGFASRAIRVAISADAMTAMINDSALNVSSALGYVVLVLALHATLMALVIGQLVGELAALSRYDVLTGLLNRRAIQEELDAQVRRSKRDNESFSALMIDVDRFKAINDRHGHPVGDLALKHVAELLRIDLREVDRIGRFGGEEFLVMLPGASGEHAHAVAERLRAAVHERALAHSGTTIPITISIGVAQWQSDDAAQLLVRADAALYEAKRAGRDRVVLAG